MQKGGRKREQQHLSWWTETIPSGRYGSRQRQRLEKERQKGKAHRHVKTDKSAEGSKDRQDDKKTKATAIYMRMLYESMQHSHATSSEALRLTASPR